MLSLLGLMIIQTADVCSLPTAMWGLSGEKLRSRIVGNQIRTTDEPPPGQDRVTIEWFHKDGRYFRYYHGHEELGSYRFEGDMICVRLNDRERCRAGLTDTNGDLWLLSRDKDRTRLQRHAITDLNR